jgi:hypothetical protein
MTVTEVHAEQIAVGRALHFVREGGSRKMPSGRVAEPAADGESGNASPARDLGAVEALAREFDHALEFLSRSHPPTIPHAAARVANWHKLVAPTIGAAPGWWN